ncbi:MAG TPA: PaaI family thioesterase [Candidatus Acidoferrum sp.]
MTQAAKHERQGLAPLNGPKLNEQAKQFAAAARRALRTSNATRFLGFTLESINKGHVVLRLNAGTRHTQLHGVVHGGILAALADTAGAMAAYTMVPKGTAIATIEMKINYLEPVRAGRVRAEATVLRAGRNFVVSECEILSPTGKLAAKALITYGAAAGYSMDR